MNDPSAHVTPTTTLQLTPTKKFPRTPVGLDALTPAQSGFQNFRNSGFRYPSPHRLTENLHCQNLAHGGPSGLPDGGGDPCLKPARTGCISEPTLCSLSVPPPLNFPAKGTGWSRCVECDGFRRKFSCSRAVRLSVSNEKFRGEWGGRNSEFLKT